MQRRLWIFCLLNLTACRGCSTPDAAPLARWLPADAEGVAWTQPLGTSLPRVHAGLSAWLEPVRPGGLAQLTQALEHRLGHYPFTAAGQSAAGLDPSRGALLWLPKDAQGAPILALGTTNAERALQTLSQVMARLGYEVRADRVVADQPLIGFGRPFGDSTAFGIWLAQPAGALLISWGPPEALAAALSAPAPQTPHLALAQAAQQPEDFGLWLGAPPTTTSLSTLQMDVQGLAISSLWPLDAPTLAALMPPPNAPSLPQLATRAPADSLWVGLSRVPATAAYALDAYAQSHVRQAAARSALLDWLQALPLPNFSAAELKASLAQLTGAGHLSLQLAPPSIPPLPLVQLMRQWPLHLEVSASADAQNPAALQALVQRLRPPQVAAPVDPEAVFLRGSLKLGDSQLPLAFQGLGSQLLAAAPPAALAGQKARLQASPSTLPALLASGSSQSLLPEGLALAVLRLPTLAEQLRLRLPPDLPGGMAGLVDSAQALCRRTGDIAIGLDRLPEGARLRLRLQLP